MTAAARRAGKTPTGLSKNLEAVSWLPILIGLLSALPLPSCSPEVGTDLRARQEHSGVVGTVVSPGEAVDLDPGEGQVRVLLVAAPFGSNDWAYNGQIPGPTIRAKVGDQVTVELVSELPNPTTIHWHGLEVPFAMDGVPWMTSPVPSMGVFEYSFTVTTPGTFWYHPHFDTYHQVDRGLYGAFIVEPKAESANEADRDLVLVFDQPNEAVKHDDGPEHTHGLVSLDTPWLVNGQVNPIAALEAGERVHVRMVNASNSGHLKVTWPQMRHIGGDQGLFADLAQPEAVVLGPGDRGEFEWLGEGPGFAVLNLPYTLNGGAALGEAKSLLQVGIQGAPTPVTPISWPFVSGLPTADPGTTDVVYVLSGSAEAKGWMINGETFPDVTIFEALVGDEVIMEIRNLSATEHPFHMHGHAFEVLSVDGIAPSGRLVEDTINVAIRSIVRLRFLATNPGDWMTHCHILPHADGGMMTVLRVLP